MLTLHQKATILRRTGVIVPVRHQVQMTAAHEPAADATCNTQHPKGWADQVEALHAKHVMERATRSLQQAQAALQMEALPHPAQRGASSMV